MKYVQMPGTSLIPSVICLGTEQFGSGITEKDAFAMMDSYFDQGGNFIDTAKVYGDWVPGTSSMSEKTIGSWLKSRRNRSRTVLATKGGHPELQTMHISRLEEKDIRHDVERSLVHLETDYIDIYWLHRDDLGKPAGEMIECLNKLVREGKIRYFACSNWKSSRIEEAQMYASGKGLQGFAANQLRWSLASYPASSDSTMVTMDEVEFAYHQHTGLPVVPYNSQASGLFSGRYSADSVANLPPLNAIVRNLCTPDNLQKLKRLEAASERLGISMTQVALAYLLSQPFSVYPIVGCRNIDQLTESCSSGDITLNPVMMNELLSDSNQEREAL